MPLTQTQTKIKTSTKVLLITLALSGVALAAGLIINSITPEKEDFANPEVAGNCRETDRWIDFQKAGIATKGRTSSPDQCKAGNKLQEFYCDGQKITSKIFNCTKCQDNTCDTLKCTSDSECNDYDAYTEKETCDTTGQKCLSKKITKYFDLTFLYDSQTELSNPYRFSIQDLKSNETSDQLNEKFFYKKNSFLAEFIDANGQVLDSYSFDFPQGAIHDTAILDDGQLVSDNFFQIKLPYNEKYKKLTIYAPFKKFKITNEINLDPNNFPDPKKVKTDASIKIEKKQKVTKPKNQFKNKTEATPIEVLNCPVPPSEVDPKKINIIDNTSRSGYDLSKLQELVKQALGKTSLEMAYTEKLKAIIFVDAEGLKAAFGGNYSDGVAGFYRRQTGEVYVGASFYSINHSIEMPSDEEVAFIISHEVAHAYNYEISGLGFWWEWFPDSFHNAWKSIAGDVYGDKYVNLEFMAWKEPCSQQEEDWYGVRNGCTRPYGCKNWKEDVAEFIALAGRGGGDFAFYLKQDSRHEAKLAILKEYKFITPEQYRYITKCFCDDKDHTYDKCGALSERSTFNPNVIVASSVATGARSFSDVCQNSDFLSEYICFQNEYNGITDKCAFGCGTKDGKGACQSCAVLSGKVETVEFYIDTTDDNIEKSRPKANPPEAKECSADGKKLIKRSCADPFSTTVKEETEDCEWKCEGQTCLNCPAGSWPTSKYGGNNRCPISYGTVKETCLDNDGDGCCVWTPQSCLSDEYCESGQCKKAGWTGQSCTQAESNCGTQCLNAGTKAYKNCMSNGDRPGDYEWYRGVCRSPCRSQGNGSSCWAFCD